MPETRVKITILDETASLEACAAHCGNDWAKPESIETARQRIKERFGGMAELEYVDLTRCGAAAAGKLKAAVEGMPRPVLLANGRPRIAGEFDTRQILDVIEVDLEAGL